MDNDREGSPEISSSNAVTPPQQQQQTRPAQLQTPLSQSLQEEQKPVQQQQNNTQAASGGLNTTSTPTSSGEGRRISCEDIQLVQNLIERCLQLYMNQEEVINTLLHQAKIEPGFTSLVWQKLEEQNPDFFNAYYIRLKLKRQIVVFNLLLDQQAQLMQRMCPTKATMASFQNGMHVPPVHHMPIGYPVPPLQPIPARNHLHMVHMSMPSPSPHIFNGGPPMAESFTAAHGSPGPNGAVNMTSEVPLILPTGSGISTMGSDLAMSSAAMLDGTSAFPFSAMGNPTDMTGIGMDVPNMPLGTAAAIGGTHGQNGMGTFQIPVEPDAGGGRESLGFLGQFSLTDLTAELTNSSDILGNYSGSPFLTSDYIQSPEKDDLGNVSSKCRCSFVFDSGGVLRKRCCRGLKPSYICVNHTVSFVDDEKILDHITDMTYEDFMDEK